MSVAEGSTVLIVDDTLANLRLLTDMLREQGYKVRGAPNGDIALNAARSAPPGVILLDINMPGKNGYDVCRELKADDATKHIPVIFLSALDEPLDKVAAFDVGGADYVSKPFQIEEVLARVDHQLRLRRLQDDLRRSRVQAEAASQAKSVFLANMSHEIRTPMNAILGYARIMGDDPSLSELQRKAVDTIESSGRHLLELINDILDLSKIEAGREELQVDAFVLEDLVRDLAMLFEMRCRQRGLSWRVDVPDAATTVGGDERKLRQVLINLLGNAVKFTESGEVTFSLRAAGDGRYAFEVSDTGPGIPADRQQAIFDPFHQEATGIQQGGTGLGLAITQRHVALMDGAIELESEPGRGTRFTVVLPLPDAQGSATAAAPSVWSAPCRLAAGTEVKALVVDDVDTNRDVLEYMLTALGAEVLVAADGEQALELVADAIPDVAFLDIGMPGMDGVALLAALHERHGRQALRSVAISASALEHQQRAYIESGFDTFVGKPYRREQICACLVELLGTRFEPLPDAPAPEKVGHPDDAPPTPLPADQLEALREAVDTHNMTQLRQHLGALENGDHSQQQLAHRLRPLCQRYDFAGLTVALREIPEA